MPRRSSRNKKSSGKQSEDFTELAENFKFKKGKIPKKTQNIEYDELKDLSAVTPANKSKRKASKSRSKKKRSRKSEPENEDSIENEPEEVDNDQENIEVQQSPSRSSRKKKKQRVGDENVDIQNQPDISSPPKSSKGKFKYPVIDYQLDYSILKNVEDDKSIATNILESICENELEGLTNQLKSKLPQPRQFIYEQLKEILEELTDVSNLEFSSTPIQITDELDKSTKVALGEIEEDVSNLQSQVEECSNLLKNKKRESKSKKRRSKGGDPTTSSSIIPSHLQLGVLDDEEEKEEEDSSSTQSILSNVSSLLANVRDCSARVNGEKEDIKQLIQTSTAHQTELFNASQPLMMSSSSSSSSSSSGAAELIGRLTRK